MAPVFDELEILSDRIQPPGLPRPVISSLDTWDQSTQIDYPFLASHVGRRPGWNIPSISVANEAIATIRSSTNLRFVSPQIPTVAGMFPDPVINPNVIGFLAIPNMTQSIRSDSSVQITFSVSVSTASAGDFVRFAIFRDGGQVSQLFTITTSVANSPSHVAGSYTDTPVVGRHVYDLRWESGASQAKAFYKNRTFQVQNLRAQ